MPASLVTLPAMFTRIPSPARCSAFLVSFLVVLAGYSAVAGAAPQVLPAGQLPNDVRLQPLKDLEGYFPFTPPKTRPDWDKRAERVRRQILVSLGLWPMPARTPLNPIRHGRIDQGDYTVEK